MEASIAPDQALATQLALRVALQTMKERCISLQKRLTAVEEENQELRDRLENEPHSTKPASSASSVVENFQLRNQIAELDRQKTQLSEHINMVSTENRKLWSRLSQIAKEQGSECSTVNSGLHTNVAKDNHSTLTNSNTTDISPRGSSANQNLIRSKTFTQHSPNPNLRHKIIPTESMVDDTQDKSLEEITLNTFHQNECGAGEEYAVELATEAELGFAYLNVDESGNASDTELNAEAKKCIDGFEEMRREALRHQQELNAAFTLLETKLAKTHCPECEKKAQKPEMADKSLETDDSLSELKLYNAPPVGTNLDMHSTQATKSNSDDHSVVQPRLNIIQEKIQADLYDKTCPMCGKVFSSAVQFIVFREHVETHFIDDSNDVEASIDRNFEFISHTVGDF